MKNKTNFKSREEKFSKIMKEIFLYGIYMIALASVLFYTFTFIHESGHRQAMRSEGIASTFSLSLAWPHGETLPASVEDCEKFNALSQDAKAKIYYGGIKYNSLTLIVVVFLLVATVALALNNPQMVRKRWYCLLLLGLAVAIIALVYPITQNSNPSLLGSDMWKLVNNYAFNCPALYG